MEDFEMMLASPTQNDVGTMYPLQNDDMFYTLNKYLQTIASYQQQFPSANLPNLPGLNPSMMQPGTSFQSLPPSRIPSPHHQFQRQSSPQPYNRSSPTFQSPPPAHMKRSASVSSRQSREESVSPIHQNSWSFEEQFKQSTVFLQLYDIDRDDPKRKEFLDDLFSFMQKHETPVTRLPIMAKSVLDLYELYKLVVQRGGLVDVINKKLWQEVIKGLNLPSSITSAAFTLRTQYMKFLYRYECHKLDLSKPHELQAAIEGNKREGRRTSYYGDLGQMHSPNSNGPNNGHPPTSMHHGQSQMSPVSLVTTSTSNTGSNRLQMNGHSNQFVSHTGNATIPSAHGISPLMLQGSPELPESSNLSGFMTQLALWNLYNGAMKQPLQQPPVLPFQPARPPSQNSNNEAPLDLGKNRKEDRNSLELPPPKREARDNEGDDEEENETEDTDSDSDDEPECQIPLNNSSQDTENSVNSSPVVVKIKINGTKYRGILHPKIAKRPKVGPLQ